MNCKACFWGHIANSMVVCLIVSITQSMWSLNPACVSESCAHHLLSIKNTVILIISSSLLCASMHVLRKVHY